MRDYLREFISGLFKLDPIKVFGVAKILGIKISEDVDGAQLIVQMGEAFSKLNRYNRKQMIKLVEEAQD